MVSRLAQPIENRAHFTEYLAYCLSYFNQELNLLLVGAGDWLEIKLFTHSGDWPFSFIFTSHQLQSFFTLLKLPGK
jgi:hypothetical protein